MSHDINTSQQTAAEAVADNSSIVGKVLRRTAYGIGALLLLIIVLLVSPWGTQVILSAADSSLDELEIDYSSGALLSELRLSSVNWSQVGTQANIKDLKLDISLSCLFTGKVCIELVGAKRIDVQITPAKDTPQAEPTESGLVAMPLPIKVEQIAFGELNVSVKDQLDLAWQSLDGKLSFYEIFKLDTLSIQGLKVTTYSAPEQTVNASAKTNANTKTPDAFDFTSLKYQPIQSLPIELPIHFQVKHFALPNLQLNLAGQEPLVFDTIELQISGDSQQVNLQQLLVKHLKGQVEVDAKIGLTGDLRHELNVAAKGELQPEQVASLSLHSTGSIQNLTTDIKVSGPFDFDTNIQAQPANEKLPLAIKVNWQDVAWPLLVTDAEPDFESAKGQISLTGDLQYLVLAVATQVAGKGIPSTELELNGAANLFDINKQVDISQILVQTLGGKIISQGQLVLNKDLSWQGKTQLDSINLTELLPEYPAELNGELNVQVNNQQGIWQGAVDKLDIHGVWMDYPLSATGMVDFHQQTGLNVAEFWLTNGANKIALSGTLDKQNVLDFSFDINAPKIAQSVPEVHGSILLNGLLKGSIKQPQVSYQISASNLSTADITISKIAGAGDVTWDDIKPISLDLSIEQIELADNRIDKASIKVKGNALAHQLAIVSSGEQLHVDIALEGALTDTAWNGKWTSGDIKTHYSDLALAEPFDIHADWAQQSYSISGHCWQESTSQLCIKKASFAQQKAQWDISLADFDWSSILQKLELEGPKIQTTSLLNIETTGSWDLQQDPLAELSVSLTPAAWTITTDQSLNLDLQAFAVKAQVTAQTVAANINVQGSDIGKIKVDIQTDSAVLQQDLSKPIAGNLELSGINIGAFKALVPQLDVLQGLVKGKSDISGTMQKPLVNGILQLENAALKGEGLPVSLSEVTQTIKLNGNNADFEGSYKFGKGYGELSGEISWLPDLAGKINIKGEGLELNHQDMVKAQISPNINLSFAPEGIDLRGEIVVPYARVKIRDLPPGSISPSGDVILVEQEDAENAAQQKLDIDLLIKVDPIKKDEVKLDAYGLTSDLQGDLRVESNTKGMLANGEVRLVNGRYRGNGQNLVIREGDISFNGPIDRPYLNVEAIRDPQLTEDGVIAGLRVQGEAEKPTVAIFSEPEMEQQQSLSYMLTGRGIGESSDDSQDTAITNALVSIGLGQSENLVSKVGNKFGFQDMALDTSGQGTDTMVALTGTIAPGLQIKYAMPVFDSVAEMSIRYELMPKLYVEAVSGLSNAVDLYYQFSLEGSQNKKVLDEKH